MSDCSVFYSLYLDVSVTYDRGSLALPRNVRILLRFVGLCILSTTYLWRKVHLNAMPSLKM